MIEENRFGFETEITAKVAQPNAESMKLISYYGRTYEEGKKSAGRRRPRALHDSKNISGVGSNSLQNYMFRRRHVAVKFSQTIEEGRLRFLLGSSYEVATWI